MGSLRLSNGDMPTVGEIRRTNLLLLIEQVGSIQAFANLIERSHSQVSQLKNANEHSTTHEPRVMGDTLARHIEAMTGKPRGWMDVQQADNRAVWVNQSTGEKWTGETVPGELGPHAAVFGARPKATKAKAKAHKTTRRAK
jgi:hypothetical protein